MNLIECAAPLRRYLLVLMPILALSVMSCSRKTLTTETRSLRADSLHSERRADSLALQATAERLVSRIEALVESHTVSIRVDTPRTITLRTVTIDARRTDTATADRLAAEAYTDRHTAHWEHTDSTAQGTTDSRHPPNPRMPRISRLIAALIAGMIIMMATIRWLSGK